MTSPLDLDLDSGLARRPRGLLSVDRARDVRSLRCSFVFSDQSAGMGDHVCKFVCIEKKITGRKVADHRNLVLRFALMTQHN